MEEQLVSFETAVLAKEKGFDWKVLTVFAKEDGEYGLKPYKKGDVVILYTAESFTGIDTYTEMLNSEGYSNNAEALSCPTQALLQKWLRDVHKIHIELIVYMDDTWSVNLVYKDAPYAYDDVNAPDEGKDCETYEKALEIGLEQALLLINTK